MNNLRCRPGDLARITCSTNRTLINRICIVEYRNDTERWAVTLLGEPAFGLTRRDRRPVVTNDFSFRDSSLEPLRGEEPADQQHYFRVSRRMHSAEHSLQGTGGA